MSDYRPQLHDIQKAKQRISGVVVNTPLTLNAQLSERYAANVWLKREDATPQTSGSSAKTCR